MRRLAFTMIELIFVIVVIGILSKFGVEFLAQAYNNFIYSQINHNLQVKSEAAIETIAARLQYRIKDSIIARDPLIANTFQGLASSNLGATATVLEWVGMDIDGLRGESLPMWSGIIDLKNVGTSAINLVSPETNTTALTQQISQLSNGTNLIDNAAIYFVGSDSDIVTGYGWNPGGLNNHNNSTMHRIDLVAGNPNRFLSGIIGVDFSGTDIYEYYQLSWTAYAVVHNTINGDLTLHYNYQPWEGDTFLVDNAGNPTNSELIMQNVDTFRFTAIGSVVKIQVCVNSPIIDGSNPGAGGYSLCKEKTIF